jgi:hypothetical protein
MLGATRAMRGRRRSDRVTRFVLERARTSLYLEGNGGRARVCALVPGWPRWRPAVFPSGLAPWRPTVCRRVSDSPLTETLILLRSATLSLGHERTTMDMTLEIQKFDGIRRVDRPDPITTQRGPPKKRKPRGRAGTRGSQSDLLGGEITPNLRSAHQRCKADATRRRRGDSIGEGRDECGLH